MGRYLDIARKAVDEYRREQTRRLAAERQEKVSKIEEIVLQHYSDRLQGEAGSLDNLIKDLEIWNPYFKRVEMAIIEEAVRAASEQMAKSQDLHDTKDRPVHQRSCEGAVDHAQAADHQVEHDGVGTTPEADEPEIEIEGQPPEEPAGPGSHSDAEFAMDQVVRVAEVLRKHREKQTWDADTLVEEGFFHDKLGFEPTTAIVEEAQCMLLLPEG